MFRKNQNLKEIFKKDRNLNSKGIALLLAIIIVGLMLSISFSLSAIFIPKVGLSSDIKNSPTALYAADTGLEWCLYVNQKASSNPPSQPTFSTGATLSIDPDDCSTSPIVSTGEFNGTYRALQVTF